MSESLPQALHAHAAALLAQVLRFELPADTVVQQYLKRERRLGARDRARLSDLVFGCLRHLPRLRVVAGADADAAALVEAWLDGGWTSLDAATLDRASAADMPAWLLAAWPWQDAAEAQAMAEAFNVPAPLDLRVNIAKAKRDAVQAALARDGIETEAGRWSPHALRVMGKPALQRHPLMNDGTLEVQDEGSQLLGFLLAPRRGELVVDFCAGAGGKALHMGAMMRNAGRIHAFDVSAGRLSALSLRARRAGLSIVHPMAITDERDTRLGRLAGKADRVLVDAPCSGLGTLRRAPDLKWRQGPEDVHARAAVQSAILESAARLVKPGGVLVYATCSMLAEENEQVVDRFVAAHEAFRLEPCRPVLEKQGVALPADERDALHLDPLHHDTDAFYGVRLVRAA
ncbi:RsmB/NOP family class I SAM-dependent RNA methyltransferase [Nitrogeniibacter mangrovi]|uniref:RsmB/NOP family class I SAM-dependent RNA methyltransferase n=1 Tax=Nitrogeniibacter mangrovi TaxID=2016596 RepID=UPI001E3516F1|nr:RsmB/NOP family class I SAM-dependent RNA methyltransferase [Nitrogeniibacter mangrovi]